MARIDSYPATSTLADDDYFLVNGATNGTRRVSGANLSGEMQRLAPSLDAYEEMPTITGTDFILMCTAGGVVGKISFNALVESVRAALELEEG